MEMEKNKKIYSWLIKTFWALMVGGLVVAFEIFVPVSRKIFVGSEIFLLPIVVFSLLGIALIVLTIKAKVTGKIKKFLMLTGISSTGFFVFIFLHNAFYGLGIITKHINILNRLMEGLSAVSFIIALFGCPIGFIIGVCGSIILGKDLLWKEKKREID
ncbi:MAG: hypothetical protein JW983_06355 [Elusimicrobia bacterium]|nr:hypothetical protein [Elusimicrobiota bacterium]